MKWKCRIGLHDWYFGDKYTVAIYDSYSREYQESRYYQMKTCKDCNRNKEVKLNTSIVYKNKCGTYLK